MIGGLDQRHHFHGGEAGLAATLVVERGDAHQTVGAAFHGQSAVSVGGVHLEGGGLDARLFGVGGVHDLGLEAVTLAVAQVHAQQHLREVGRVDAAGTGADGHHGGTFVIFAVKQGLNLHLVEILLDLADFALRLVQRVLIALLVAEFDERFHIVDALGGGVQTLQLRFRGGQPAGDLLGVFRVIPQARGRGLRFEILDIGLESVDVQRLGDGFVFGAGFADRLGKVKFCHRGLPYC